MQGHLPQRAFIPAKYGHNRLIFRCLNFKKTSHKPKSTSKDSAYTELLGAKARRVYSQTLLFTPQAPPGTAAAPGTPKAARAPLLQRPGEGRERLLVNTTRGGSGSRPRFPRVAKGSGSRWGGRRELLPSPPRGWQLGPGPAHRTRLTSPFLQLVKRSLVSMAGAGRGAAAPH